MIIIHGLKACDTCRKAIRALREAGHDARLRDFRETPPTETELLKWQAEFGSALLNTRSTTWRGLDEAARAAAPVGLMLDHPALVKRPVVEAGGAVHLGWTEATKTAVGLG